MGGTRQKAPKKKPPARGHVQKPGPLKVDDLFVRRDNGGELVPIVVEVPGMNGKTIKVLPTTIGSFKGVTDPEKDAIHWPMDEKIRFMTSHVVDPDMSGVSHDDALENITLFDLDMLLVAVMQGGGPQRQVRQEKKE